MTDLLLLAIGASLVYAHLLTGTAGMCPLAGVSSRFQVTTVLSLATLLVVAVAGPVAYALHDAVLVPAGLATLTPLALVVLVVAATGVLGAWTRQRRPALHGLLGGLPAIVAANGALLGIALLPIVRGRAPLPAMILATCAALVFGLVAPCADGLRERLAAADVPLAFRGLPIVLVTAALVALALMGYGGIVTR
jgi:electron transport complex protein RnfA